MFEPTVISERIPPQNLEAEVSVLGAMLQDRDALAKAAEILNKDSFYRESHKIIFSTILDLFEKGEAVDLITVSEALRKKEQLELVGGVTYLTTLINTVPTAANIVHYAKIVQEKALLRNLISAGTKIVRLGYEPEGDIELVLDTAEKTIFSISQHMGHQDFITIKGAVENVFDILEKYSKSQKGLTGISTGFVDFDRLTSGLQNSDLIIIAGRTGMGKTSLGMNIAQYVAIREKTPVAIFSLEMSGLQLAQRMLCSEAHVNSQHLRASKLQDEDIIGLTRAAGILSEAPIFIDDTPGISTMELRARARRLKAEVNLGLIVVDYLQIMTTGRGFLESKVQEVTEISRSLKSLARELDIPIIALSQLSREVERRKGTEKIPQLSDLRESGAIEQDADLVAFIYRKEAYDSITKQVKEPVRERDETKLEPEEAKLIIAKQRNGPTGVITLYFLKNYTKFVGQEKEREPE